MSIGAVLAAALPPGELIAGIRQRGTFTPVECESLTRYASQSRTREIGINPDELFRLIESGLSVLKKSRPFTKLLSEANLVKALGELHNNKLAVNKLGELWADPIFAAEHSNRIFESLGMQVTAGSREACEMLEQQVYARHALPRSVSAPSFIGEYEDLGFRDEAANALFDAGLKTTDFLLCSSIFRGLIARSSDPFIADILSGKNPKCRVTTLNAVSGVSRIGEIHKAVELSRGAYELCGNVAEVLASGCVSLILHEHTDSPQLATVRSLCSLSLEVHSKHDVSVVKEVARMLAEPTSRTGGKNTGVVLEELANKFAEKGFQARAGFEEQDVKNLVRALAFDTNVGECGDVESLSSLRSVLRSSPAGAVALLTFLGNASHISTPQRHAALFREVILTLAARDKETGGTGPSKSDLRRQLKDAIGALPSHTERAEVYSELFNRLQRDLPDPTVILARELLAQSVVEYARGQRMVEGGKELIEKAKLFIHMNGLYMSRSGEVKTSEGRYVKPASNFITRLLEPVRGRLMSLLDTISEWRYFRS